MKPLRLAGRSAVVTGAGGAIGRETAIALAGAGARVAVTDVDLEAAQQTASLIGARAYTLDVRDGDAFAGVLAEVETVDGPLALLVNNAGVMPLGPFLQEPAAVTQHTLDINLGGVINGCRAALPGMVERGAGHVVNIASMMGRMHAPGAATYGAAKHAVVGFGGAVRDELTGTGVTLTTVLPSAVRTPLISGLDLGAFPPVVEPYEVAAAVRAACDHRRAEVTVPGWLGHAPEVERLLPRRLTAFVRTRLGGDAALRPDHDQRAAYEQRARGVIA